MLTAAQETRRKKNLAGDSGKVTTERMSQLGFWPPTETNLKKKII